MTWENGEYQPKQERADEKKNRLINAGLALFSRVGYHGTHAREIAAEAGVATGSFYRYFRNKKALFMAVCHRTETEMGMQLFVKGRQMREQGYTEEKILRKMIEAAVSMHHNNAAFHREVLAMQIKDPDIAEWGEKREQRFLDALGNFLKERRKEYKARDFNAMVAMVFYTIEETAHRAVLFESPLGEKRLTRALQDMLSAYLFS